MLEGNSFFLAWESYFIVKKIVISLIDDDKSWQFLFK